MSSERMLSRQEVTSHLQRYDITKNSRLSALLSLDLYPHNRRCAVLVPLFLHPDDEQWHVLLTQRASTLRTHASTVALPGGVQDPSDDDDVQTALREAHEEIGLPPHDVTVVARLPPTFARVNNSVFPVVGFIPGQFRASPNPEEVDCVFSVPLRKFVEGDVTFRPFEMYGMRFLSPLMEHVVDGCTQVVWGMTCSICIAVARVVLSPSKHYRFLLGQEKGEKNSGEGCSDDLDENDLFSDWIQYYHWVCQRARPKGSHL